MTLEAIRIDVVFGQWYGYVDAERSMTRAIMSPGDALEQDQNLNESMIIVNWSAP